MKLNRCPSCRASYYHLERGVTKPFFVCSTGCGYRWNYGHDGGPHFALATNSSGTTPQDWTEAGRTALEEAE